MCGACPFLPLCNSESKQSKEKWFGSLSRHILSKLESQFYLLLFSFWGDKTDPRHSTSCQISRCNCITLSGPPSFAYLQPMDSSKAIKRRISFLAFTSAACRRAIVVGNTFVQKHVMRWRRELSLQFLCIKTLTMSHV